MMSALTIWKLPESTFTLYGHVAIGGLLTERFSISIVEQNYRILPSTDSDLTTRDVHLCVKKDDRIKPYAKLRKLLNKLRQKPCSDSPDVISDVKEILSNLDINISSSCVEDLE